MLLDKIYFPYNGINSNSLEFLSDFTNGILISMKTHKYCIFGELAYSS